MIKKSFDLILKNYFRYKEIINYLIAGFLTVIVSVSSYALFTKVFHIHYIVSNIVSWVLAVLFAYYVNSKYVFDGTYSKKEIIDFFKFRVLSLIIEVVLMFLLVDIVVINDMVSKVVVQFIVIILNYIFSKYLIFK